MTAFIKDLGRLVLKALPLIISLVSTSVIFLSMVNFHPMIGTVSTEVISIWV